MERKGKTKGKSGSYSLSEGELDEVQRLLNLGIGHGIHLYMLSGMSGCKDIGKNYFFNDQIKCFFQASSFVRHSVSGRHEARRRRALQIQLRNKADSTGHRDASGNANGGGQFQKLLFLISFSFCISSSLI